MTELNNINNIKICHVRFELDYFFYQSTIECDRSVVSHIINVMKSDNINNYENRKDKRLT